MPSTLYPLLVASVFLSSAFEAHASPSLTFGGSGKHSTVTLDPSSASTYLPNNDFSNEQLNFLWNQVGPISVGPVTTTVSPTPEPTAFPRPGALHPMVPSYEPSLANATLPDDFVWGVAASCYQIEGAAKDEGKGPSIWDLLSHRVPNTVADNSTGDVVAQHYYLYKQDIARLKALGVPYFSPSFSWGRFFPFGKGPVNAAGVAHYDDVIAEMVSNGIKPAVTLFHWDTPLALFNEYGAWADPQIIDDFVNYAKYVISRYDEYVSVWFTINEPQYCDWQFSLYPAGEYYPSYNNISGGLPARVACSHHTLIAHAKIAKWYHEEFKGKGRITFKNSGNYFPPSSDSEADKVAAQRNYDFSLGWFNNGPWGDGDYPESVKETLGDLLPALTREEKDLIKGSCDFFALDGYTAHYAFEVEGGVDACISDPTNGNYPTCAGTVSAAPDGFPVGPAGDPDVDWLYDTPVGIRRFLKTITKDLFPSIPDIMVTEFGFAEPFEGQFTDVNQILWDLRRADYYQGFLDNILASREIDGVNVTGAFGWAIFDNFEWFVGNSVKFGMQYYDPVTLERSPKASFFQFLDFFKQHGGASLEE
ncbi:hypothetical protein FQN54_004541 [Arachnomyces sp. PD_36]|nr:hypothetical protein FQN54_004541 [Arachnomyces sp. PD_36]